MALSIIILPCRPPALSADVRICSPDSTGLGCDLARTLFDFGLVIERGDFSTDGLWSYLMFRVRPGKGAREANWSLLKQRLESVCPSDPTAASLRSNLAGREARRPLQFIFQVAAGDRVGLLHDVSTALWERELTVHRAHVSTSPSNQAVDLFYVSDRRNELPSTERFQEIQAHARARLGDAQASFSLHPAPVTHCRCDALIPCDGSICGVRQAPDVPAAPSGAADSDDADLCVSLHPLAYPVLTLRAGRTSAWLATAPRQSPWTTSRPRRTPCCRSVRGIGRGFSSTACAPRRTCRSTCPTARHVPWEGSAVSGDSSDCAAQVQVRDSGICELDLFVSRTSCEEVERELCERLRKAIERPLEVGLKPLAADAVTTELCVTAPMDASGCARPRVLLGASHARASHHPAS